MASMEKIFCWLLLLTLLYCILLLTLCTLHTLVFIHRLDKLFVLIVWVRDDFTDHAMHITFLIVLLLVSARRVPVSLKWYVGLQHLSIVRQW